VSDDWRIVGVTHAHLNNIYKNVDFLDRTTDWTRHSFWNIVTR